MDKQQRKISKRLTGEWTLERFIRLRDNLRKLDSPEGAAIVEKLAEEQGLKLPVY